MAEQFRRLLEPIVINGLTVPNRIVMPPMDCNYAAPGGEVTQRMIDHYEERAKHRVGLIVVEATAVVDGVKNLALQPVLSQDHHVAGFERLVEAIHSWGSKTILQIQHSGNEAGYGPLVSPSDRPSRAVGGRPRPLTAAEIEQFIEDFVNCAGRAQVAGFDGIELHGAHGYLVNQFMSPYYNQRTDMYGGPVANRARFPVRIIEEIKSRLGREFVVGVRYSADEFIDGGLTVEESKEFARLFQQAGADLLHVSGGVYDSAIFTIAPAGLPQGMLTHLAAQIKQAVDIPVITVHRILDPVTAERILEEGQADMVAFGRALLADAKLAAKVYEGRADEIRKCIGCRYCIDRTPKGLDAKCAVNPALGREREFSSEAVAPRSKKVLVVGGGPAGMQAAVSARKLGHQVTLVEKEDRLGGQLNLAVIPPEKDIHYLLEYLKIKIDRLGVEVKLKTEADARFIGRGGHDAVILAVGARERSLAGLKPDGKTVLSAWDALMNPEKVGRRVVVVGGGGTGCETAEFLANREMEINYQGMIGLGPELKYEVKAGKKSRGGREVVILEMLDQLAPDKEMLARQVLLIRLEEKGVRMITRAAAQRIDGRALTYFDMGAGRTEVIEADTFVVSVGVEPNRELAEALGSSSKKVKVVGDCLKPAGVPEAIFQGALAAARI